MKDKVIFRKWKDTGDIIAVLPGVLTLGNEVTMYEHIGQHGAGDYQLVLALTVPAKPEEYQDLLNELEHMGYRPHVIKRLRL